MAKRTCTIENCDATHYARGWCSKHYGRWRTHGSTDDPRPTIRDRFWSKVAVREPGECWEWQARRHPRGHGMFTPVLTAVYAHRFAYEDMIGPIPDGLVIDHLCRNRGCVNPDHLEPVTQATNVLRGESAPARQARQTHCKWGHPFDEVNTYWRPDGRGRQCRICIRLRGSL